MSRVSKTQSITTTLLMWISQLLLLLFLAQWIRTSYKDQKIGLQKNLALQFELMESRLTDSMAFDVMTEVPRTDSLSTKMQIKFTPDDKVDKHRTATVITDNIYAVDMITPDNGGKHSVKGFERKIVVNSGEELHRQMIDSTLPIMIAKGIKVFLSDSANRFILRANDTTLKENFHKQLAKQNMSFDLSWRSSKDTQGLVISKPVPPYTKVLVARNYEGYVWKKLLPETGFAILLLTITAAAFWTMHRSFKKQQRLSAMKNDLVSNMAHELKTPVATVKVALEALDSFQVINDPKTSRDYIKMAVSEVERLELLVSQALNTSLLETGNISLQKEHIAADELTEQTVNTLQIKFQQKDAQVSVRKQGNNFSVHADKLHIQGVLINLLDNSLKYAGEHAVIAVSIEEKDQKVNIHVKDNGPGIPAKYIDKVFDKFFRVPTGDVHTIKGYGLGLSYAKQAIENMGGRITARNNEDAGCTFTISLPKV